MRITDNKNIAEAFGSDSGNVVICDSENIREFVDCLLKRKTEPDCTYGGIRRIRVVTSELPCELVSKCGEKNIFENVYEVWYDCYSASGEMTSVIESITDMRNKKILYNTSYGNFKNGGSTNILYDLYMKSRDVFRERLFSYIEKRNDMFNRDCVTSVSL